jgi:Carboxypeptidase regulatory-like domain/TonB dependent receptor
MGRSECPRLHRRGDKNMTKLTKANGRCLAMRKCLGTLMALLFSALWLLHSDLGRAQTGTNPGSIKGQVLVVDATGTSYVPGAQILLNGPVSLQTESDAAGQYTFASVVPGTYTLQATAPGLETQQPVIVSSDETIEVRLELQISRTTTDVKVTASSTDAEVSTTTQTLEQKTIDDAPNADQKFETLLPLVPGVVRGPDGRINMKGARNTQSGALVNSANVTDPALGGPAISLPIDVVSSVQVVSNPFDPQYGRFTGALSTVETKTADYQKAHFSIQNVVPRWRERGGTIAGLGAATPRITVTGPLVRNRAAYIESFEYRFLRTPVNSLPPLQRDTKLEGFNSYSQADVSPNSKQTATVSLAIYPQKLDYMGLNTFTPQPSTTDFKQRGYQVYAQHRYFAGEDTALVSQFSYKTYDVDLNPQSEEPYRLLIDTTEGGFFNQQRRRTSRYESLESYQFAPRHFLGSHQIKAGFDYAHSELAGVEAFRPVELVGASEDTIERIEFSKASAFEVNQNEAAFYSSDQWTVSSRLLLNYGVRVDTDTITSSVHVGPRAGVLLSLTGDGKTLVKGGAGIFYDRVPLMLPKFVDFPGRTVTLIGPDGQVSSSTAFNNQIAGSLENPRSTTWNIEIEREVTQRLAVRVGYENRVTARDLIVSSHSDGQSGVIALSNLGSDSYREFQVSGRYKFPRAALNGSYVRSRVYGDLNDPFLFIGNYPQAVIQPDQKGRLTFDAPNRVLFWSDTQGPWKLNIVPVFDVHTGYPYSAQNEYRDYVGPRSSMRYPRFQSADLQITRPFTTHFRSKQLHLRAGGSVFNVFNHDNPRDVQNNLASSSFGSFYNDAWREYRGKMVFEF